MAVGGRVRVADVPQEIAAQLHAAGRHTLPVELVPTAGAGPTVTFTSRLALYLARKSMTRCRADSSLG